jgi:hypothetical protein
MKTGILLFIFIATFLVNGFGQRKPSNSLDYGKLAGFALNNDIRAILKELEGVNNLTDKDQMIKTNYENRFKGAYDKTDYFLKKDTTLNPLNRIYQDYWRKSMLDNSTNYENH